MKDRNLWQCFDLLALAFVGLVVATGCGPAHRDHFDGRGRDFSSISAPSQPDRRSDNQNEKPKPLPKPAKQKAR